MSEQTQEIEAFEGAWTGVRGHVVPAHLNDLTHAVIGAAMHVHSALGPGLPERVYHEALALALVSRGISARAEVRVDIRYEGRVVGDVRLDLVVENALVVELKAVESVLDLHLAQIVTYLRAAHLPLGLLINFNVLRLKDGLYRRLHAAALPPKPP